MSQAWAAMPVISVLPPGTAIPRVALCTGLPPDELEAVDLTAVLAPGLPNATPCVVPPVTQKELDTQLSDVTKLYDSGDVGGARDRAAGWSAEIACLTGRVVPDWLWHAAFMTGLLAWAEEDPEGARAAWATARAVDPQRPWDENFAPHGAAPAAFATAIAAKFVEFQAVGGPFLVDGRDAPPVLPVGRHVVQTADAAYTWLIDVDAAVVAVHPDAKPSVLSPAEWTVVLSARLPDMRIAYLVSGEHVIRVDLVDRSTGEVSCPVIQEPPKSWGGWAMAGGTAGIVGGIVTSLVFSQVAAQAAHDVEVASAAGDLVAFDDATQRYDAARAGVYVGYGAIGVGVTFVVVGTPNFVNHRRRVTRDE